MLSDWRNFETWQDDGRRPRPSGRTGSGSSSSRSTSRRRSIAAAAEALDAFVERRKREIAAGCVNGRSPWGVIWSYEAGGHDSVVAATMARFDRFNRKITGVDGGAWAHPFALRARRRIPLVRCLEVFPGRSTPFSRRGDREPVRPLVARRGRRADPRAVRWRDRRRLLIGRWIRLTLALLFVRMLRRGSPLFPLPGRDVADLPDRPDPRGRVHHREHRAGLGRDRAGRHGPRRRAHPRAGPRPEQLTVLARTGAGTTSWSCSSRSTFVLLASIVLWKLRTHR